MNFVSNFAFLLVISSCTFFNVNGLPQSSRNSPDYSVTHLDIRDAILSLVSVLRDTMDKLERHEVRERQLGEQLTRSLATLEKRGRGEEKNIENIASYISRIDEKLKIAQQTLEKQNEEKRVEGEQMRLNFEQLKSFITQTSAGGSSTLDRKLDVLTDKVQQLKQTGDSNSAKFDSLMELSTAGNSGSGGELNESIMTELTEIKESLGKTLELETQLLSTQSGSGSSQSDWQKEIGESLDSQRKQLAVLEEDIGKAIGLLGDVIRSASSLSGVITMLDQDTKAGFQSLLAGANSSSPHASTNASHEVGNTLQSIHYSLETGQISLGERMQQTTNAIKALSEKVETEYKQLSKELKGLANVESVLLDTGDSVLDTKRRLEYGVQQIIGEINHQLSTHTGNLNASLQYRFDGLATAVLGNQSIALTNLTSRMEEEISQVWRQIGILYHQMTRSSTLLDEIHSQTSQYVNNSMSMDGKVGQITNQMGAVDDNLNYLLGRMSLVVQEFNMIKGGLGDALVSLKESFAEIGDLEGISKPQGDDGNAIRRVGGGSRETNVL